VTKNSEFSPTLSEIQTAQETLLSLGQTESNYFWKITKLSLYWEPTNVWWTDLRGLPVVNFSPYSQRLTTVVAIKTRVQCC